VSKDNPAMRLAHPVTVAGIGAGGWDGLPPATRAAITAATVLVGSDRQLALIPAGLVADGPATRIPWPTPLVPAIPGILAEHRDETICVLASGDPTCYGIGSTLVRLLGPGQVRVLPHPSSVSLARARLGWRADRTAVTSLVGQPTETLHPLVQPGRQILVLSPGSATPAQIAALLCARGYGPSHLTVLEQLGGPAERQLTGTAAHWDHPDVDPLHVVAIDCVPEPGAPLLPTTPGLPDTAYDTDGQLTKREIRVITLAALAPVPGQLLWDVGAGSGSIAIEWMRTHPTCQAIAIERDPTRSARIAANAAALGVPAVRVVTAPAPAALAGLPAPDAIFVGGGATTPGLLHDTWHVLRPGGRLVATAVTLETEQALASRYAELGGELTRIAVSRAAPVGGFTGWRPAMPVTQWAVTKP
jgi:precorrin-6Y C5,15-methyltransferase (decarboxylating)